jgi:hypothetical protein
MSRAAVLAAAFLGTLIAVGPAAAQGEPSDRHYELTWTIGAQTYPQGDHWVREQGAIIEARLLPANLYVPDGPAFAENGTPVMGSGEQLAGLYSSKLAACNTWRGSAGTVSSRDWVCLVDSDRDGRFDGYFQHGGNTAQLLTLEGEMPERLRPLRPVAYRELPATQFERAPYFKFHYQRILDSRMTVPVRIDQGMNMIRFNFTVGTRDEPIALERDCASGLWPSYCRDLSFPGQFRFAGLVLDVLERRGEDLRVRVAQPFGTGEVKVERIRETRRFMEPRGELQLIVVGIGE